MKRLFFLLLLAAPCFGQSNQACNNSLNYASGTLTASTQLIGAPASSPGIVGQAIHICSYTIQVSQTAPAVNWGLVSGTGAACATGQALVTPAYLGYASVQQSIGQVYGSGSTINLPASAALCLNLSGAPSGAVVHITYSIY